MTPKEKKAFVARMKKGKKDAAKGKTKSKGGGKFIPRPMSSQKLKSYATLYARFWNMQNYLISKWRGKPLRDFTEKEWEKVMDQPKKLGDKGIANLKKILTPAEFDQVVRYYNQAQERKKKSGFVYHRGGRGRGGGVYRRA